MADGKPEIPSQAAVFAAWGERLQRGRVYAKNAKIHAKCAAVSGTLETITKRSKISKAYKPGDYIVQGIEGERYCVDGDVFHERYAHAFEPAELILRLGGSSPHALAPKRARGQTFGPLAPACMFPTNPPSKSSSVT